MADGSRHSIYIVEEEEYGVTPTNPALQELRITGTTIGLERDSLESGEIRGDRQIADFRLGANQALGDISFELSYSTWDLLLQAALLSPDWAADTPVAGTQQIKSGVERKSFTVVRFFSDLAPTAKRYQVLRGVEMSQLQLTIPANAMVTGTLTAMGQSSEYLVDLSSMGTPTFVAPTTTRAFDSFTGLITEGGDELAVATEVQLTLANTIAPKFVVGSDNTIRPSVGRSNLTGQVAAYFESTALLEKFMGETSSALVVTLIDLAGNELAFRVPNLTYTGGKPDVSEEGPITLTVPFQAIRDPSAETNFLIERTAA